MSRFNNLRLAQRLGVAFGAMVLALVVVGALSVAKLAALDDGASALSDHGVVSQQNALQVSAAIEHASALTISHLYVHDGDLAAQDKVAAQIAPSAAPATPTSRPCASRPTTRASRR